MPHPPLLETSEPLFPPIYTYFAHSGSVSPSASSFYHNPLWSSSAMPTSSPFFSSATYKIPIQNVASSVLVQLTITIGTNNVPIISLSHPLSDQLVPPPTPPHGGQQPYPLYAPFISSGNYVSGSQTNVTRVNQNVGSVPYPSGSCIPSGSCQILY